MPIISVIMPVYNEGRYLKHAIDSILNQSFRDFEFVIIDDGSKENINKIINQYSDQRIIYYKNNRNLGITKSLNIGLQKASGKYIARMDADDVAMPDRLKVQKKYLDDNPDIFLIGAMAEIIDENDNKQKSWEYPFNYYDIAYSMFFYNPIMHSTIFFRSSLIDNVGKYNENYKFAQDFEFYTRIIKLCKVENLRDYLLQYRCHKKSISFFTETQKEQRVLADEIRFNYTRQYGIRNYKEFETFNRIGNYHDNNWYKSLKFLKYHYKIYNNFIDTNNINLKSEKSLFELFNNRNNKVINRIRQDNRLIYKLVRFYQKNVM